MAKTNINKTITEKVTVVLSIIVLILIFSNVMQILIGVANDLVSLPLGSLFSSSGFVFVLLMVGLIVTIIKLSFPKNDKG